VIARYYIDGHAASGDLQKRSHRHLDESGGDFAPVKQIPSVNDKIDLAAQGWRQGGAKIGKEVGASSSSLYPRAKRQIKTQMCISNQQNASDYELPLRLICRLEPVYDRDPHGSEVSHTLQYAGGVLQGHCLSDYPSRVKLTRGYQRKQLAIF
jgi:hypothetical protein